MGPFDVACFHLWLLLQICGVWPQVSSWGILFLCICLFHLRIEFCLVLCRLLDYVLFFQWVSVLPSFRLFLLFLGSPRVLSSKWAVILKVPYLRASLAVECCVLIVELLYPLRIVEVQRDVVR